MELAPRPVDLAFTGTDAKHPAELYYMASSTSPPRRLTDFNAPIAALALGAVDTMDWKGPDNFRQNAVITYPPDFDARKKYPVIFFIHGGADAITSVHHSRQLHDAYRGPREIWVVQGAPHTGTYFSDRQLYLERVAGFFARNLGLKASGQLRLVEDDDEEVS